MKAVFAMAYLAAGAQALSVSIYGTTEICNGAPIYNVTGLATDECQNIYPAGYTGDEGSTASYADASCTKFTIYGDENCADPGWSTPNGGDCYYLGGEIKAVKCTTS